MLNYKTEKLGEECLTKIFILLFIFIISVGCTRLQMTKYIQDRNPYKQEFYASFDKVLEATKATLAHLGWSIAQTTDPAVYEQSRNHSDGQEILILTETKQSSRILYSRYYQLNVFLHALKNATEVEIRYSVVTSFPLKEFHGYRNNALAREIFKEISSQLEK